jgi:mannose-1-phosphate guanylyltransferase
MGIKGVILVGGGSKGTRFRPLSFDLPKPLIPIAGKPMILHHLEHLARVPGLTEVILLGFYDESMFSDFVANTSNHLGITVRYLREVAALGTAGGIWRYQDAIRSGSPEAIFILHCDIASSFPLNEMLEFHREHRKPLTVLGKTVPPSGDARAYGCMVKHPETCELLHYVEKPETWVSNLINCGIYIADTNSFYVLLDKVVSERDRWGAMDSVSNLSGANLSGSDGSRIRLEQDIIMQYEGRQTVYIYEHSDFWCQIKEPAAALLASKLYLEHYVSANPSMLADYSYRPEALASRLYSSTSDDFGRGSVSMSSSAPTFAGAVFVHSTVRIAASAKIGPNVSIGAGCVIGAGARLFHCIILEDCVIREHALVANSIIGWSSVIGPWARVEGKGVESEPREISVLGSHVECEGGVVIRNCIVLPHKTLTVSASERIIL